ncbi:MAG TPA: efflux RND transporter periplasmic adaptor subunit [Dongiaceae bacterium]|jgi:membrane fusion protein (multidrug efflux system)|nr:efflux RND transporter periplasmic adaptor subunit [Dongiaceae bacterium]
MIKRMVIMLGLMLLLVAALAGRKVLQIKAAMAAGAKYAQPPTAVTTAKVREEKWQPTLLAVGSLKAVNGVTISTDLAGIVSEIAFQSGAVVQKGDLLVRLDSKQEQAQLQAAEARRDLAKLSLKRQQDLLANKTIAQADYDAADSEYRQAVAAVEDAKALIARKTITAPFAGRLGIRQADLGQYLNTGAPIVQLESIDPIHVEFSVPQQNFERVAVGKKFRLLVTGVSTNPIAGEITALESRLDESTRNLLVQGTVPNPDNKLRAGMFVNVAVLLPETDVLTIPSSSISYAPYGDSVFVVTNSTGADGKPAQIVEQHFVKLGQTQGDMVTVVSGVKAGDEVVSSGAFKLRNQAPVIVNNAVQPGDELHPNPPEM